MSNLTLYSDRTVDGTLYHRTALSFNGTTQYINVPHNTSLNFGAGDFTVNFWMKRETLGGLNRGVIGKRPAAATAGWAFRYSSGVSAWEFICIDSSLVTNVRKQISVSLTPLNTWVMITLVRVGNNIANFRIHVNGGPNVGTDFQSGATLNGDGSVSNTEPLTIGAQFPTSDKFIGQLADFQLYNIALTQAQIERLYNKGTGASPIVLGNSSNSVFINNLRLWHKLESEQLYTNEELSVDQSGQKNHGTLIGYTLDAGQPVASSKTYKSFNEKFDVSSGIQVANSMLFDGIDDYISIPNSTSNNIIGSNSNWSISIWTRLESIQTGNSRAVFCKRISGGTSRGINFFSRSFSNGNRFRFEMFDSSLIMSLNGPVYSSGDVGKWFHHVIVRNGSTITMYQNGVVVNSGTSSNDVSNTVPILLGDWEGIRFANISLANIQLYNTNLSASEVSVLYNNGRLTSPISSLSSNLISYYNFAETPTSTTITDRSGNGNTGTLFGFTSLNYSTSNKARTSLASDLRDDAVIDTPYKWCASFTGGTQEINLGDPTALRFGTGDFSIAFWCKIDTSLNIGAGGPGITKNVDTNNRLWVNYRDWGEGRLIRFQIRNANLAKSVWFGNHLNPTWSIGEWFHIVAVKVGNDPNNWLMYRNGRLITSKLIEANNSFTANADLIGGQWRIGRETIIVGVGNNRFANVQFFNRALTSAEAAELASRHLIWGDTPVSAQSALVGKWLLNDIEGVNVRDYSGNGNNGTVNNAGAATNLNGGFWLNDGPDNRYLKI